MDTLLYVACANGFFTLAKISIRLGANVNSEYDGVSQLHTSVYQGYLRITKLLLNNGANIEARTNRNETPLAIAAHSGNMKIFKLLIKRGANTEALGDYGTILHYACTGNNPKIVRLLINSGKDIETENSFGTSLHVALYKGSTDLVRFLVKSGANIEALDGRLGLTPLYIACSRGCEITKMLIDHGANLERRFPNGNTILHMACSKELTDVVEMLIYRGANINVTNNYDEMPIHISFSLGDYKTAKLLIRKGVSTDTKVIGKSLLRIACKRGNSHMISLLTEKESEIGDYAYIESLVATIGAD